MEEEGLEEPDELDGVLRGEGSQGLVRIRDLVLGTALNCFSLSLLMLIASFFFSISSLL